MQYVTYPQLINRSSRLTCLWKRANW